MLDGLFANRGVLRQAVELRAENGGLEFAQAVIKADDAVMKLVGEAGATGVDVSFAPVPGIQDYW